MEASGRHDAFFQFAMGLFALTYSFRKLLKTFGRPHWAVQLFVPIGLALCTTWLYYDRPNPLELIQTKWNNRPTGTWLTDEHGIPYQWHQFGHSIQTYDTLVPVLSCVWYNEASVVQQELLPSVEEPDPDQLADRPPSFVNSMIERYEQIIMARADGLHRCLIPASSDTWLHLDTEMTHLTDPMFPSLLDLGKEFASDVNSESTPVTSLFISRSGEIAIRVLAASRETVSHRPNQGAAVRKKDVVSLRPQLLDPSTLVSTAADWIIEIRHRAGTTIKLEPCICVAHFGIIRSGMHLNFNYESKKWELWYNVRDVTSEATIRNAPYVEYNQAYQSYLSNFPFRVHEKLSTLVATDSHPKEIDVAFNTLDDLSHDVIENHHPFWLLPHKSPSSPAGGNLTQSQLMAILPFDAIFTKQTTRHLDERATGCFAYCRRVEDVIKRGAFVMQDQ